MQKGSRYIRGNVYFCLIVFSSLSSTKPCLRLFKICFDREITGFYQSSLGNELISWTYERFPKQQINRLRNSFADKIEVSNMASTSSCHRKTFLPFCLRKKIPENAFLTLTVNYHKIVQKNKLYYSKQH